MERASKLIRGLGLPGDTITAEQLACAAWPNAVGTKVAVHTRAARMVRTRLIVEVEDIVWQRQLFALTGQILRNIEKHIGAGVVDDLEFRIVPRRRGPQREILAATPLLDEADGITDPVLRGIYRASRKKALA
jgi:Dna[CI] antecedent DciA-like protein